MPAQKPALPSRMASPTPLDNCPPSQSPQMVKRIMTFLSCTQTNNPMHTELAISKSPCAFSSSSRQFYYVK